MATSFECPECGTRFRTERPKGGRKLLCPKCDATFRPPVEDDPEEPRSDRRRRREDDEDADRPRRKKSASGSGSGLLIGLLVGGGILFLGGAGVAAWLVLGRNAEKEQPVVEGTPNPALPPKQADVPPPNKKQGGAPGSTTTSLSKAQRATALIRVDAGGRGASGSGFLVKVNGDTGYLITNHHVIDPGADDPPEQQQKGPGKFPGPPRPPGFPGRPPGFPGGFGRGFPGRPGAPQQAPKAKTKVTVILESGTPNEQSVPAEVVAYDDEADLAALRITGVRNLPEAIDLAQQAPVAETQPVNIFGFPGGRSTITTGKGTVSGLRHNDNGELVDVHINGELNPGNSGGPVVDNDGRLIGVAVASVVEKKIGFAIPASELNKMLKGSILGAIVFQVRQQGFRTDLSGEIWRFDRNAKIRGRDALHVQLDVRDKIDTAPYEFIGLLRLTDPMHKVNAAILYYSLAPKTPLAANGKSWPQLPGATKMAMKISDQDAMVEFKLPVGLSPDETYAFQFSYVNADGETIFSQPHTLRLTFPKNIKSVNVEIAMPTDEPSRRFIQDQLTKIVPGVTVRSTFTQNGLHVEIEPVDDPKTIADRITFGDVTSISGRTIAVTIKKVELPVPTDAEVSGALADLRSTDAKRRSAGVDKLSKMYAPLPDKRADVSKALVGELSSKDHFYRMAILRGLAIWGGPEIAADLAKYLEHEDVFTRKGALTALAKLKDPAAAPAIAKMLPALGERGEASAALKAIGQPAEKAVIPYVKHSDIFTAAEACNILKEIGSTESLTALKAVLAGKPNPLVANSANAAVKAIEERKKEK